MQNWLCDSNNIPFYPVRIQQQSQCIIDAHCHDLNHNVLSLWVL